MNPNQMAQQIKSELETVVWPSGAGDVVFGGRGVRVFAGNPTEDQLPAAYPFALVIVDTGTPDEDEPNLVAQSFRILTVVMVKGDPMGEQSIIGGPIADIGKSAGRGVCEVAERSRAAVQDLTGVDGARVLLSLSSMSTPSFLKGHHIVVDEFSVTMVGTSVLEFTAPQEITLAGITWTWEGAQCSNRFDFVQYRLGIKAGAVPPSSPADADSIIYTGIPATVDVASTPSSSYTIFADYSSRGATIEGSSGAVVGAILSTTS